MDDNFIHVSNRCIDLVEYFLLNSVVENLPFCRIGLDSSSVRFIGGTEANHAAPDLGLVSGGILIKDAEDFDECWNVIMAERRIHKKFHKELKIDVKPSFSREELTENSMPIEILCRGITTSLLKKSVSDASASRPQTMLVPQDQYTRLRNKLLNDLDDKLVESIAQPDLARPISVDFQKELIEPIFSTQEQLELWASSWNIKITTYKIKNGYSVTNWVSLSKSRPPSR